MNKILSYPVKSFYSNEHCNDSFSKGHIVLEDDVWIGYGSMILSGVTIGQGSVVGANTVVSKDIPPYSIVVGNPMKVIKSRFSKDLIDKLLKIDLSKIDIKDLDLFYKDISMDNIDDIIKELNA
jgi:acetyltransferase-like isoleucine patch superfamily enzyme